MQSDNKAVAAAMRRIDTGIADLARLMPGEDTIADVIGDVRAFERRLENYRHKLEGAAVAEPAIVDTEDPTPQGRKRPAVAEGKRYRVVPKYTTKRSFNTPAILSAVTDALDVDTFTALMLARDAGAVRITWTWTKLERFLSDSRVGLRKAYEEVTDHDGTDGAMVGEVRKQSGVDRIPIKEGESE